MSSTDKEISASEHFDNAISASTIDQVSALGPAGLSGAQVALLALILGGLLGIAGLKLADLIYGARRYSIIEVR